MLPDADPSTQVGIQGELFQPVHGGFHSGPSIRRLPGDIKPGDGLGLEGKEFS